MRVTIEDVRRVAFLARLSLAEDELDRLRSELDTILRHFESLNEVATAETDAAFQSPTNVDVLRSDDVGEMLSTEEAMSNAPDAERGHFRVPGFLPEE